MSKQVFSNPGIIMSPISGEPCKPTLATFIRGNKRVTEATYIDPASRMFIRKHIVSVEDVETPCTSK